ASRSVTDVIRYWVAKPVAEIVDESWQIIPNWDIERRHGMCVYVADRSILSGKFADPVDDTAKGNVLANGPHVMPNSSGHSFSVNRILACSCLSDLPQRT